MFERVAQASSSNRYHRRPCLCEARVAQASVPVRDRAGTIRLWRIPACWRYDRLSSLSPSLSPSLWLQAGWPAVPGRGAETAPLRTNQYRVTITRD